MQPDQTTLYPSEQLKEFTINVFLHFGVPKADAEQAADVLSLSDLRGY
jgi:LDH2 family malate/lactate/ureidoglycolate dehydrogenase